MKKFDNYRKALTKLIEGIENLSTNNTAIVRDGVIQRFEFTAELAWKTIKEYLEDHQFSEVNTPKIALQKAYAIDLIDDELQWIDMLRARNLTSHIYNENTAIEISNKIKDEFIPLFLKLQDKLETLI